MKFDGNYKQNIDGDITSYIFFNRGITDVHRYMNLTKEEVNDYRLLDEDELKKAFKVLATTIAQNKTCFIVVDADADGYCSAAILINYLHDNFPSWVENNLVYFLHDGKQHGLSDCYEEAAKYDLCICPDSSSNDYSFHKYLKENNTETIVLDHHEAPHISEDAIVINNQLSDYPNKQFCGGGIVWQFIRYCDAMFCKGNSEWESKYENYIDLVALSNVSDMMSLTSYETTFLIREGFNNLKNPFLFGMAKKNAFSLGGEISPIGCAFYITPFINAIVRSGTQEEKYLVFQSMLKHGAFRVVPSTKRGHKLGEMETVLDQALRTCTNVKNRQTKAQDKGMEFLESQIEENNMLEHKALVFLLEHDEVDPAIRGLAANKIMAKYQRPCFVLSRHQGEACEEYAGSARCYTKSGITNLKDIVNEFEKCIYAEGHQAAFGTAIPIDEAAAFIDYLDTKLADVGTEPVYHCDIIYDIDNLDMNDIITIGSLEKYWGQDIDEPLVAVENLTITPDMVTVYNKKGNTLKIHLPNGVDIMKFKATDEECDMFKESNHTIDLIAKCNLNEWNGRINGQLFIEDYEAYKHAKWIF